MTKEPEATKVDPQMASRPGKISYVLGGLAIVAAAYWIFLH